MVMNRWKWELPGFKPLFINEKRARVKITLSWNYSCYSHMGSPLNERTDQATFGILPWVAALLCVCGILLTFYFWMIL